MISELAGKSELSGVLSPLLPRIYSDFYSGGSSNVKLQYDGEKLTAVLAEISGHFTFIKVGNPDYDEISAYLNFCGAKSFTSDCVNPVFESAKQKEEYILMKYNDALNNTENSSVKCLSAYSKTGDYREAFSLLHIPESDFNEWYADLSRKINNENAFCTYIENEKAIVSVAVSPSVAPRSAIISGVVTSVDSRKKGYASGCLSALINELLKSGKTEIYLWCENRMCGFYEKRGFTEAGKIYIGTEL